MGWPMPPLIPPDTEAFVTAGLADLLSPVPVSTDTVGWEKGDDRVVVAMLSPIVVRNRMWTPIELTSVAGSKEAASDLARAAHAAILGLPTVTGSGVTAVNAQSGPRPLPTPDTADGIARYSASYLVLVSGATA